MSGSYSNNSQSKDAWVRRSKAKRTSARPAQNPANCLQARPGAKILESRLQRSPHSLHLDQAREALVILLACCAGLRDVEAELMCFLWPLRDRYGPQLPSVESYVFGFMAFIVLSCAGSGSGQRHGVEKGWNAVTCLSQNPSS